MLFRSGPENQVSGEGKPPHRKDIQQGKRGEKMIRSRAHFFIRDNGGRRTGNDRRRHASQGNGIERRSGQDRRIVKDRRKMTNPRVPGVWELQVERRASFVRFHHFERRCKGKNYVRGGFIHSPLCGI